MSKREDIIRKIKAMQARIDDAASSISEVNKAMRMVAKWMKQYNLSQSDIETAREGIDGFRTTTGPATEQQPIINLVLKAIEKLTQTRLVVVKGSESYVAAFYGTGPDVQYAEFLYRLSEKALEQATRAYQGNKHYHNLCGRMDAHIVLQAFQMGFVKNLYHRIMDLVPVAEEGNGTSLVLVKNALIAQELNLPPEGEGKPGALVLSDNTLDATIAGANESQKLRLRFETNAQTKYLKQE